MLEGAEYRTGMYMIVHDGSNAVPTMQLLSVVAFRSIQGTCVRSVHKVMGQLKVHFSSWTKRVFSKYPIKSLERKLLPFCKKRYQTVNFHTPYSHI